MNTVNRRFIAMPYFLNLKKQNLKTLDILVYITIRSFHNSTTGLCYPSYEKIIEKSGLSRGFISSSIKRLEFAGHFKVDHSKRQGTCNRYLFQKVDPFKPIPYELFDATDLSSYEKAMLLCLRPFFVLELNLYLGSIKELANDLGISYKQVYSPYKTLIDKGYLKEVSNVSKDSQNGKIYLKLTDKIDWDYDFSGADRPLSIERDINSVELKVA